MIGNCFSEELRIGDSSGYQAADLTIVPSQYTEGFGRVICESLACGTPVVASKIGGIPDAMDETVGILSSIDVDSFAKALQRISEDRALYERCRLRIREMWVKNRRT